MPRGAVCRWSLCARKSGRAIEYESRNGLLAIRQRAWCHPQPTEAPTPTTTTSSALIARWSMSAYRPMRRFDPTAIVRPVGGLGPNRPSWAPLLSLSVCDLLGATLQGGGPRGCLGKLALVGVQQTGGAAFVGGAGIVALSNPSPLFVAKRRALVGTQTLSQASIRGVQPLVLEIALIADVVFERQRHAAGSLDTGVVARLQRRVGGGRVVAARSREGHEVKVAKAHMTPSKRS